MKTLTGFGLAFFGIVTMMAAGILSLGGAGLAFPLTLIGCGALFAYCGIDLMKGAK